MKIITLLVLAGFTAISFSLLSVPATYIASTLEEVEEVGLILSFENPNDLFPDLEGLPISFSLDTGSFSACNIESVFFSVLDTNGNHVFGSVVGQRLGKYRFRLQPTYLNSSHLSVYCEELFIEETTTTEQGPEVYTLNLGQIISSQ